MGMLGETEEIVLTLRIMSFFYVLPGVPSVCRVFHDQLRFLGLSLSLWALSLQAVAAEIGVDYEEGRYHIQFRLETALPPHEVYSKLTNYNHLNQINPSILESKLLGIEADGTRRVYSMIRGCVMLFCENLRRVERVQERSPHLIVSEILPELSDFKSGLSQWHIFPSETGSQIFFEAMLEPKRSLKVFIGIWLVKRSIKKELELSAPLLGDVMLIQ